MSNFTVNLHFVTGTLGDSGDITPYKTLRVRASRISIAAMDWIMAQKLTFFPPE